ncbi:hypothetical protein MC7420_4880 [Coleofasciculus chthonoplastes PCC 7420]|uniref:Uncharacterized protein n=1 Tax=Coleofasciculus chthonoplastes PCC 7420 TaxID=118168 RepID=B4VNJ3_9CYAN|nr:hypothetical protein [Coleofasciculus chthonoplastes]EDX76624.1 hypothetical protein MC7420_4880 [Coleofasciculus chthonoplastes PCC 7420]
MLIIRKEQLDVFQNNAINKFYQKTAILFKRLYPNRTNSLDGEALIDFIRRGTAQCRDYGLERECDIQQYIGIMFILGINFSNKVEPDWAKAMMTNTSYSPEIRLIKFKSFVFDQIKNGKER